MAEPSTYHNYSFEDIQRYLQGKMSAAEMHEMEKTALQDHFLADAIEGFNEADLAKSRQHLNEINADLFAEKQKSKVVGFNKRTQWLNVAAITIVLAGIAVVASYFIKSSTLNKSTEIAQVKNKPAKNETPRDSLLTTPNTNELAKKNDTALLIAANKAAKKVQPSFSKRKVPQAAAKEYDTEIASVSATPIQLNEVPPSMRDTAGYVSNANKPSFPQQAMAARSQAVGDTPLLLLEKKNELSVLPFIFSGKIVDENNYPVPFAVIAPGDTAKKSFADENGDFKLYKKDSLINVTVSSTGYHSLNVTLKEGVNNPIILKINKDLALTDAVITTAAQKNTHPDSSMPVGGWNNFNRYVMSALGKDSISGNGQPADNQVELEFLVDKSGNPYNIIIIKSLNEQRNAKAIDILKNGPKWIISSRKQKATVTINF